MASPSPASTEDVPGAQRPSKRQKTWTVEEREESAATEVTPEGEQRKVQEEEDGEASKEHAIGVKLFVSPSSTGSESGPNPSPSPNSLFRGILKKRYTDFLVNEILPDGKVLRLKDLKPRKIRAPSIAKDDEQGPDNLERISSVKKPTSTSYDNTGDDSKPLDHDKTYTNSTTRANADSPASDEVSSNDRDLLSSYLGETTTTNLIALFHRINSNASTADRSRDRPGTVTAPTVLDRATRTKVHECIRTIFSSRVDSHTDKGGVLSFSAASQAKPSSSRDSKGNSGRNKQTPKLSWSDRGGEYLHFSIYKENKDTMEVISYLARQLRINTKSFAFAGTKDKRAVTVQRACVHKCEAERLVGLNRTLRASAVGDYSYHPRALALGDLSGNEFYLTLRDCMLGTYHDSPDQGSMIERRDHTQVIIEGAMRDLREEGFLNYYGLQRFGTFAERTDSVGIKLLQNDFWGAVDAILQYNPEALSTLAADGIEIPSDRRISSDDHNRASAISLFRSTGSSHRALEKLPRKFSAESNVIRHLSKTPNDYAGAVQTIPRNLRLMYVHAYQSLVWNNAASARWAAFGPQVVEGDLVLVHEHCDKEQGAEATAASATVADADGEAIILPTADDRAKTTDDAFERARPLSAAEAASGAYNIFDVVIPLPGYDVLYPANDTLKDWYQDFMGREGLNPFDMRRKQRDFSLSGGYRKLLARIGAGWEVTVKIYGDKGDDEQFVETDLERIREGKRENQGPANGSVGRESDGVRGDKLAVILKFQLGASQYATMALRELSKGGIDAHKGEYSGGR